MTDAQCLRDRLIVVGLHLVPVLGRPAEGLGEADRDLWCGVYITVLT